MNYDPFIAPDSEDWLEMDEMERIEAVQRYHRRARIELPNETVHASVHAMVENQAALGDETPVAGIIKRLQKEGLDRHDAIHAVGSVLTDMMWHAGTGKTIGDPTQYYYDQLEKLTAQGWLDSFDSD